MMMVSRRSRPTCDRSYSGSVLFIILVDRAYLDVISLVVVAALAK